VFVGKARLDDALVIVARGPAQRQGLRPGLGDLCGGVGFRLVPERAALVERILLLVQQLAMRLREIARTLQ